MTSIFTSYLEITRARKTNLGQILHLLHVFLYSERVKMETRSRCVNQASGWRSEVRLPNRKEIFLFYKTSSPRCLLLNRYKCSFLGVKRPGRKFTTHIHLVLKLRTSGAAPPIPLCVFMACTVTKISYFWTYRLESHDRYWIIKSKEYK